MSAELNIDAERAAFEAWHQQHFGLPPHRAQIHHGGNKSGLEYWGDHTNQSWAGWQERARRAAPSSSADELPPLPKAHEFVVRGIPRYVFTADQMQDCARTAVAADRARQGEPVDPGGFERIEKAAADAMHVFSESCNHTHQAIDYMKAVLVTELERAAIQAAAPADAPMVLLKRILDGDVGRQILGKLARGQSTETDDGKAWLAAKALVSGKVEDAREQQPDDRTSALIEAADAYAAAYDDDDRECIKADVINAFYAGSVFRTEEQIQRRRVMQAMADCMDMVRSELIEAGIIDAEVPPMFVANAVVQHIALLHRQQRDGGKQDSLSSESKEG